MKVKEFAEFLLSLPSEQQEMDLRVQGCDQCWLDPQREVEVVKSDESDGTDVVLVLT